MKKVDCTDCIGRFVCHSGIKNGSEQCLTFCNVVEQSNQNVIAQVAAKIESVEASLECGDPIAMRKILRDCVKQLRLEE